MDTMDTIYTRRSIRNYQDGPVDKAVVEKLIDAAIQAPTATNAQPWVFGVIQGADKLKELSDIAKENLLKTMKPGSPLEKYRESLSSPDFNIFYNASTLVIICAKPNLSPAPMIDCALAAENLMLAARDMGLGTCWIGFSLAYLNTPQGKQDLGIAEDISVVAPIIVGYPEGEPSAREKNPPEILFWKG